ncbi:MAG: hypothetical protein IKO83_01525 [Oscillospiraceae bacterium]|nr:hypothetical protein [Oscillospiraceae bacterium]MBR4548582.1 hypothetical protein [Oscillospiraceae bacterium]
MKDVPEVGEPICWTPAAFTHNTDNSAGVLGLTVRVSGRIVYVNAEHRWYRAEATFPGGTIREGFKF